MKLTENTTELLSGWLKHVEAGRLLTSVFLKSWTRALLQITTLDLSNSEVIESTSATQGCDSPATLITLSNFAALKQNYFLPHVFESCSHPQAASVCVLVTLFLMHEQPFITFPLTFAFAWHLYASDHTNQKSVVSLLTAWHCSIAAATKKWHAVETAMLQAMVSIFCYMQARWHRKAKTTLLPVFFLTQSWHDVLSRWTHIELWRLRSQSDSAQVQYVCVFLELDMNWKSGDLSRSHIIKIDFYPSLESPNCRPMQC